MHLRLVVYLLVLSVVLTNVVIVVSLEPISTTVGIAAVIGWFYGTETGRETRKNVAEKVSVCNFVECCNPTNIIYDIDKLRDDLKVNLFGQHIVNATLIPALRAHHRNLERSEKPLVMSFHGTMGTGKNFVSDLIIKHLYHKGEKSAYVHKYMARKDFPLAAEVDKYRIQLAKEITAAIASCKQSLFVFDEVEKMPAGVFESITTLLDHHSHVRGVDFRQAIFIFLTNAGGKQIAMKLHDVMEAGTYRDATTIKHFEFIVEHAAFNDGGLKKASIITSGLIDHYIPFLPLEKVHIGDCVRTEFKKINLVPNEDNVSDIVENYVSYNEYGFSTYGCKRISKKVQASVEEI